MLSRLYALFIGIVLIVMAIGGYSSTQFMGATSLGPLIPTVWLIVGIIALAVGFFVRNVNTLRAFSGIVGGIFLLWGIIGLLGGSSMLDVLLMTISAIGAAGVAAALAPAQWIREREVYSHG